MSDPLRTDSPRAHDDASADAVGLGRDAKIEQLLLAGLDHYLAAQYEQAINVWTRALFLDRNHPRARAYIDRARSALAERQRASEELLQSGRAAFDRGDIDGARRLVQAAVDSGAPLEDASPILDRLHRVDAASAAGADVQSARKASREPGRAARRGGLRIAAAVLVTVAAAVGLVGSYAAGSWDAGWRRTWLPLSAAEAPAAAPAQPNLTLPPPTRGELALARARALAASGYLHDALAVLDRVRLTDPENAEADRLRGDIQRQLLRLGRLP